MSLRRRPLVLMLLGSTPLAACLPAPQLEPAPPLAPIRLLVNGASVLPAYPVGAPPPGDFVTARRQREARVAVEAALRSLLVAGGGQAFARLELTAADLAERALPESGGMTGLLGLAPVSELQMRLAGDLVIADESGNELARASADVDRAVPVDAGTTVPGKEQQVDRLVADTIRLFGETLHHAARDRLAPWLA